MVFICGGVDVITSATVFSNTPWHHVAFEQSAANAWTLYVDGALDATSTTSCTPNSTANQLRYGKHISNNFPVSGDLAEIGIWSTPLSAPEIKSLSLGTTPDSIRRGNLLIYTPLNGRTTTGVTTSEIQVDLSGHAAANGVMQVGTSTGNVTTDNHCPCSAPAGSESH